MLAAQYPSIHFLPEAGSKNTLGAASLDRWQLESPMVLQSVQLQAQALAAVRQP